MSDRALISEIAATFADALEAHHAVRCETEGCHYAIHAGSPERAQEAYEEHLRISAVHTGGVWIDRDGQKRRGLEP